MTTYLDGIVAWHRDRARADERDLGELHQRAVEAMQSPSGRSFETSVRDAPGVAIIAEIKRRSPSKGVLDDLLDPADTARQYVEGGAACLSVLTDSPHFGGSETDLRHARAAVSVPVLRKDFTVSLGDVYDAALMGADAILLIVAALSDAELTQYIAAGSSLGLPALVEIHDEEELRRALAAGAHIVGVNQRDLRTFEVDSGRAVRVAEAIPSSVVSVAESGIIEAAQVGRLADAGFDAMLIGEALVRAPDRVAALRALLLAGSGVA